MVIGILNNSFVNLSTSQSKAFTSNPLAHQFGIYLDGISNEMADVKLHYATKETKIDFSNKRIDFIITRTI